MEAKIQAEVKGSASEFRLEATEDLESELDEPLVLADERVELRAITCSSIKRWGRSPLSALFSH